MRILRITSLGYESGGAENGIVLVEPELERLGHTVMVLASDAASDTSHFSDRTFPALSRQPTFLKPFYGCFYPPVYRAVRQAINDFVPDVAHVHTTSQLSPAVFFALRGVPTVLTIHGAEDFTYSLMRWGFPDTFFQKDGVTLNLTGLLHYGYHRFINGPLYRVAFRHSMMKVSLSRAMQSMLARDGIHTTYVPNATKLLTPAPFDSSSRTVLYVGRLEMIKGVQHLLAAFREVRVQVPDATLVIAGTGSAHDELVNYARTLPQGSVHFMGHLTRERLIEQYRAAAVCVIPSVWPEPFGKVGIEAMSAGRPVIGSHVGGISEWLADGETGYLVPPAEPHALARRILDIITDDTLRRMMGERAALRARLFSIEAHAARMVEVYKEVIARRR